MGWRLPCLALCSPAFAAELTFPPELQASAGWHTLTIGHTAFGNYGIDTRGFNGGLPGPTFRMQPGGTLQVTLKNDLVASNNVSCTLTTDEFCETATTNLHTHGLHVSSKGVGDGLTYYSDDIFASVLPGASIQFQFDITENHMGGTHWYHPHHHHATALQAGGGAAGVIIVEDPEGYLPEVYSEMPEFILFMSGHNLVTLQDMATSSQSTLFETAVDAADTANLDTNVFFVNGQVGPTLTMASNTWHRLRMVYAAVEQTLDLTLTGDATCEMKLLAKDGVYLHTMPRDITRVVLVPGSRADVALACSCTTYPCTASVQSGARRRLQGPGGPGGGMGGGGQGPNEPGGATVTVTLMELSITDGGADAAPELTEYSVQRPCYLVNLQDATVPDANKGALVLDGLNRKVTFNGNGESMTYENTHANGATMAVWPAITDFSVGSLYEMTVDGAGGHPLHLHINPFQITAMDAPTYADGYFAVGDWHDTLMIEDSDGLITIRQQTDTFTGKMVVHCHILEHEDQGMMSWIDITGNEGTQYAEASTLDSTCYTGSFDASTQVTTDPNASTTPSTTAEIAPSTTPSTTAEIAPVDGAPGRRGSWPCLLAVAGGAASLLLAAV